MKAMYLKIEISTWVSCYTIFLLFFMQRVFVCLVNAGNIIHFHIFEHSISTFSAPFVCSSLISLNWPYTLEWDAMLALISGLTECF